jgi:hypothetical protein
MSKQYFLPRTDLEKQDWLKNFAAKLPNYAVKYNLSADEVTDMQNSSLWFSYWMDYRTQLEESFRKSTGFKNEAINGIAPGATPSIPPVPVAMPAMPTEVAPGIFKRATSIANVIKSKSTYTIADGNDLGIEGAEDVTNVQQMKPLVSLHLIAGGKPEIKWTKQGMDGIEIYVDRGANTWAMLAYDTYPDYTDTTPLPASGTSAVWKYKAIYRYNDEQAGLWSDVVSITVTGI